MKCLNRCDDPAEVSFTWPTSRGPQSANLCGVCSAHWWNENKNTNCGLGLIIRGPLNKREREALANDHKASVDLDPESF